MVNLLFYTGIFSTVILVIQVILTLIGMGAESPEFDADTDMEFDGTDSDFDGTAQFSIFTFKSLISLLAKGSWTTLACRQGGI